MSCAVRADVEPLLLTIADHLHEHCSCPPGATGDARCAACDLRLQLRDVREQLLAWRAQGRRIAQRRDDAVDNGATHLARNAAHCADCSALSAMATVARSHATYSATSSA